MQGVITSLKNILVQSMQYTHILSPINSTSQVLCTGILGKYRGSYIKIITATLLVIVKSCKQPKYTPRREQLNYKTYA